MVLQILVAPCSSVQYPNCVPGQNKQNIRIWTSKMRMTLKMFEADSGRLAWWEAQQGWGDRVRWLRPEWGNLAHPHLAWNHDSFWQTWLRQPNEIRRHPDLKCTCLKIPATGKLAFVGDFHHPWWHLKQSIQSNCIFHLLLNEAKNSGWYVFFLTGLNGLRSTLN